MSTGTFHPIRIFTIVLLVMAFLEGCGTSSTTPGAPAPPDSPSATVPKPAMSLRVGSLDVGSFRGRIDQPLVTELAGLISKMKLDVIAIQGLTRYPGISTRTDLIDALAAATGMRTSFGETIAVSGRQSGNAVLSSYPITSSDSRNYDGISGTGFEGALQTIVDAGTRTIVIISTRLPRPLSGRDLRICAGTLDGIAAEYPKEPLIVLGNLPGTPAVDTWKTAARDGTGKVFSWFTPRGISVSKGEGGHCRLGDVRVVDMDIFPRGRP